MVSTQGQPAREKTKKKGAGVFTAGEVLAPFLVLDLWQKKVLTPFLSGFYLAYQFFLC